MRTDPQSRPPCCLAGRVLDRSGDRPPPPQLPHASRPPPARHAVAWLAVEWLKRPLDEGGCISIRDSLRPGGTSYGLKHHFSSDTGEYIPNGTFIVALALAGCTLKRVHFDSLNAKSSAWPSREATIRMAFSHERVGAREKLADSSTVRRNVLRAFARAATGTDFAARPEFWEWVCERRAQDNPHGDFVRDARAVREDRNGAEGWHEAYPLRLAVAGAVRPWNPDAVGPMPAYKHWARRYVAEGRKT